MNHSTSLPFVLLITISILASYQHIGTQWSLFSCSGSMAKMLHYSPCVLHTPCHDPLKSASYSALQNEYQVYIARILRYSHFMRVRNIAKSEY